MKQVLFLTLFGLATCSIYAPAKSYPSNQTPQPFRQYGPPAVKYGVPPFQRQVPILRLETRNTGDGTYNYAYETANGISVDEHGDTRGDGTRAQGRYSYTAPNGEGIALQYTADENGFLPQGSHLPSGLSGAILKSVQQNLEEEKRGIVDDGQYREQMQRYGQGQRYTPAQQYGVPEKYNIAQKHRVTSSYTPAQQYGVPEKYNVPQKYGVPSSYRSPANYKLSVNYGLPATNTPQRFNTQTIALPRTPQTGYY